MRRLRRRMAKPAVGVTNGESSSFSVENAFGREENLTVDILHKAEMTQNDRLRFAQGFQNKTQSQSSIIDWKQLSTVL